jgi:hypothetical protein
MLNEDLLRDKLAAGFVFLVYARDGAIKTAKWRFLQVYFDHSVIYTYPSAKSRMPV